MIGERLGMLRVLLARYRAARLGIVVSCMALAALACSPDPSSGPGPVAWDRDTCDRCRMTISDRHHAAQLRSALDGDLRRFDDLGCALLWQEDRGEENGRVSEFWVRDTQGQAWIDASQARFAGERATPMGYGFGVVDDPQALELERVRQAVREVERERRTSGR